MIVKDAANVDDPAWLNIGTFGEKPDPLKHAMMQIDPDVYNPMDHETLQTHHKRFIPLHKEWLQTNPQLSVATQAAAAAFAAYVKTPSAVAKLAVIDAALAVDIAAIMP